MNWLSFLRKTYHSKKQGNVEQSSFHILRSVQTSGQRKVRSDFVLNLNNAKIVENFNSFYKEIL
ncbi:hypothetical protein FXB70_10030 [Aggregatibacter actinomycetemcomitans]|nr:hypothetical protein FXB70_10030 [Aggregatibacter actinomycetemcomitans]TYB19276.1 hypothetical protein FXB71_10260 [Aggregatibacter actinomycetemcomitans]